MKSTDAYLDKSTDSETSNTKETCDAEHQENSWDAWLTVLGSFLIYFCSYGVVNAFGFFQDFYENDFLKSSSVSSSTISFIGTLQTALMSSLSIIFGAICDVHGVKYLYIISGLGTTGGFLALSFCKPVIYQLFLSQGLLMGISISIGTQPALTIVGQHFNKKRGLAVGIMCTGSAVGGLCFNLVFTTLKPLIGFPMTMRVAALIVLLCYAIAFKISKSKPTGRKIILSNLLDFRGFLDYRYAVLAVGAWFAYLGFWIPGYHLKAYASTAHPNNSLKEYLIPVLNSSGIPAMVIGGFLGDRFGQLNILCPTVFVCGFLCLTQWLLAPTVTALLLFSCFFGFTSGVFVTLMVAAVSQISPQDKLGARIGSFYSVVATANLIGPPIGGALVVESYKGPNAGYRGLIVFAGSTMLLASTILFSARLMHDRSLRARW